MRVAALLLSLVLAGCVSVPRDSVLPADLPYPRSRYITGVSWDFSTVASQRKAHGSDLWPCTWAADSNLYCAWGDGGGFDGDDDNVGRASLGFARIEGSPDRAHPGAFKGKNVWGAAPEYAEGQAGFGGKVGTIISVGGTLYAYGYLWTADETSDPVHRGGPGPVHRLIWSADLGRSWQIAPWTYDYLGSFLNFGQDNAGALDGFVYIYYSRGPDSQKVYLSRVPKDQLTTDPARSGAYQYLSGVDKRGGAVSWSSAQSAATPVFSDPASGGVAVVYDAPLGRYLLTASHNPGGTDASASAGQVGLFESRHPWGPWATVAYYDNWGDLGKDSFGDFLGLHFPTKWISPDGRTLWAVFSSLGQYDSFNIAQAKLSTSWWYR